eukprot:5251071-Pyramimonas_sp.AAC.1
MDTNMTAKPHVRTSLLVQDGQLPPEAAFPSTARATTSASHDDDAVSYNSTSESRIRPRLP